MNFEKFKSVLPDKANITTNDKEYIEHLNSLKNPRPSGVLKIIGTVAAAILIVLAVSLWAIIGRGIRGTEPVPTPPAAEGENIKITDDMQQQFNMMYHKLCLFALPIFERGENPSQKAFSDYVYYLETDAKSDWIITASELNGLYLKTFGVKSEFTSGINYDGPYSVNISLVERKLLSFTRSTLSNGTPIITLTYGEPDVSITTLSYVATGDFEPDYFVEHTSEQTVFIKKTEKPLEEESVYKVKGELADTILDIVQESTADKDNSICYCTPTYTVVFNGIEYRIVMGGDKSMAHTVYTSVLDGTTNNRLTETEYERLENALKEGVTDKNFVEKKAIEYSPMDTEVKIVIDEFCKKYQAGTFTVTGDDAKALIKLLAEKSYVYEQIELATGLSLQVGERYYMLNTEDEPFIQNACGRCPLSDDTQIIPLVEKYLDMRAIHYPNQAIQ